MVNWREDGWMIRLSLIHCRGDYLACATEIKLNKSRKKGEIQAQVRIVSFVDLNSDHFPIY